MGNTPCCNEVNVENGYKEDKAIIANKFLGDNGQQQNFATEENKGITISPPKQVDRDPQPLQSDSLSHLEKKYNIPPLQQTEKNGKQLSGIKEVIRQNDTPIKSIQKKSEKEAISIPKLTINVLEAIDEIQKKGKLNFYDINISFNTSIMKFGEDVYEGELNPQKNKPEGLGKMYKQDNSLYIGNFLGGNAEGQGIFIHPDGSYYHGTFKKNKADSKKGQFITTNFEYIGGFKDNLFEGHGKQKGANHQFQGEYAKGKKINGIFKWNEKNFQFIYEGEFNQRNQFHGKGKLQQRQGRYEGEFVRGKKQGKGIYYYLNGLKYDGNYKDGMKQGEGTIYNDDGSLSYQGSFRAGLPHGQGKAFPTQSQSVHNWVEGIDEEMLPQTK